jgi:hypothetical protein
MFVDENGGGRGYAPIIVRRAEFLGPVRSNASTRNAALRTCQHPGRTVGLDLAIRPDRAHRVEKIGKPVAFRLRKLMF